MAIAHAERICDWYEHMTADEMPPEWLWALDEELEAHFLEVERKRKARFGGGGGDDDEVEGPVMENELAKGRRS